MTIHVNDRDDEETVIIDYDYHKDLYYDKEIEFIHQHLLSLLWHALDNPGKRIYTIEMLPESEKRKVLYEFNNTEADYPKDKTIHQLFEQQVTKTPDNTALICEDKSITYRQLNERANSLAVLLREKGIKPGDVIAIMVRRSIEMVIGMLAVLKAGAAYLPIDKELPDERINYMIKNSESKVILTDNTTIYRFTEYDKINIQCEEHYNFKKEDLANINNVRDLAYVLYTSGTTGEPKGVMIEHTSLVNFVYAVTKFMDFSTDSIVLSYTSFCFDIFIFEIFTSLLTGAKIILANETEQKIPRYTCSLINKHRVNKILTTPSKIKLFLTDNENIKMLESIREIMVGGEVFPPELLKLLKNNLNAKIINGYGPTETTIGVSFKVFDNDNRITIGKPISNVKLYVLDKHKNLLPIGIPGELYIGGLCLGRGYINNDELTNKVFIRNPFNTNEILYKTGDIVKWCSKGEIEFLGRVDTQIKIRGYRIELDEIKNQLLKIEGIDDAAVVKLQKDGNEVICAYIIKNPKIKIAPNRIRNHLVKYLPKYMIPSYFVEVERIPINASGKIDLKKLPKPLNEQKKERILKPKNDIEYEVLNIWKDVLKKENISTNQNLYDAGGDSLSIINIISQVYSKFNVEIPLNDINKMDTVIKMALYIKKNKDKSIIKHRNDRIVLLKKVRDSKNNLFLIHAGNGEVNNYKKLSDYLNAACWGIRFGTSGAAPQNITINQIAREYVNMIKELQPNEPYLLGGWCIGGTIAFEMANILEQMGDRVNLVCLFNSISVKNWSDIKPFSFDTEMHLIRSFFDNEIDRQVENHKDINELWKFVSDKKIEKTSVINQLPDEVRDAIPGLERIQTIDMFMYINRIRTLHQARALYKPQRALNAQIVFLNAVYDKIISDKELNINTWNSYCNTEIIRIDLPSNHYTLFEEPVVYELASKINEIIAKKD